MNKYRLIIGLRTYEFLTEYEAINFRASNGLGNEAITMHTESSTVDAIANAAAAVARARGFGVQMMDEFAAKNILRGYSAAQISEIVISLANLQLLLMSGSIYTAISVIDAMTPTALVSQGDLTEFSNKLRAYVGMPQL
ncbi:MAG: hypothetical protein ACRC1W_12970 [Shewanella sp.]